MERSLLALFVASACGTAAAQSADVVALQELFGEPVTTSVTGSPQRESGVPASMEIVDADEIRRSGARDIPTLLRHVAGVDVLQTSMSHGDVAVRGYNQSFSPRLLVLLDGRQVYADYYGFTPWASIPIELDAIRQIEVVRGPNAALFGFNAVGGVINIVTYDALEDVPSSASAMVGTQDLRQVSATSGWSFGERAGLRLSVGRRENADFATPGANPGLDDERESMNVEAGFRFTDRVRAHVEATHGDALQGEVGPVYSGGNTDYETESFRVSVDAETGLGLVNASYYRNDIFALVRSSTSLVLDNELEVAQLGALTKVGKGHTVRMSLERRRSEMPTTPIASATVFYDVSSLATMWEWQVSGSVVLTNAVRFDHLELGRDGGTIPGYPWSNDFWDRHYEETSFNSGVVWTIGAADVLRFTVARGAQLPSLFNLGGVVIPIPPAGFFSGTPMLEPASVSNYEASWSHDLSVAGATLRVTAFRGHTKDVIAAAGGADFRIGILGQPANIGDSHVSGLEIAIEGGQGEWRWGASYRPLDIHDEFSSAYPFALTQTDFEHTAPRRVLKGNVGWARGPWEVDGFVRFQSSVDSISNPSPLAIAGRLSPISSYATLDGRVGYRLNERMLVALSGQGLTRSEQIETASGGPVERRLLALFRVTF